MLTALVPDSVIGTTAHVLATGRGQEAIVVDPGFDVADGVEEVLLREDVPAGLGAAGEGLTSTVLSGDVLFAGSTGRIDLPGGDGAAMSRSSRGVVLPMPDDRLVLPGHGGATTIGRERAANPHLLALR